MKFKTPIYLLFFLLACGTNPEQRLELPPSEPEVKRTTELIPEYVPTAEQVAWEGYQDSLRTELLKSKPENFLKGSLLEELYIRNLVSISIDELTFELPFDLHAFDCGAPDCYSTDIKFKFPHKNELYFPNKLSFSIYEYGCVDTELQASGTMKLVERETNFVNYYTEEFQSNLLIFRKDERKEYVYFFMNVQKDSIKGNIVNQLLSDYNEEDITAEAPYRITEMLTLEYEKFLGN